ncbi:MAG: tyrosine-type recombinase/integrase [Roseburia inulinivorans]
MKRIPFDRFSDKRFYYANAPPCKQFFSLTTDFTWRILLCTKKFLIRFDLLANKRNLKDSTIHAYCTSVAHFLNHTAKDIDALTTDDVDIFLTEKKLSGISPETYNHYHSGIRFFYKKILKKNWDDDDIPRMKRDRKLPTVLTKTEISAILDATPNLKHKAMIATMYSGGLRVSEVTHLHYDDISRTNKTIHIRDGKSRSDRYTLLADRTLEILTEYWFQCGRPRGILFPSSWTGDYLTKDSVIQFFRESAKRAGIQKHVSTHCLRHSFASHLFESGCDVKYIQALLGHRDPKSTEVYLHVSNKTLLGIRSPFDEMGGE